MPLLNIVCFFVCMAFPNIKGSCRATEGKKEWHGHAVLIEIIHVGVEFNVIRILKSRLCGHFEASLGLAETTHPGTILNNSFAKHSQMAWDLPGNHFESFPGLTKMKKYV